MKMATMLECWGHDPLAYEWPWGESKEVWVGECDPCMYAFAITRIINTSVAQKFFIVETTQTC